MLMGGSLIGIMVAGPGVSGQRLRYCGPDKALVSARLRYRQLRGRAGSRHAAILERRCSAAISRHATANEADRCCSKSRLSMAATTKLRLTPALRQLLKVMGEATSQTGRLTRRAAALGRSCGS
jgi:hypothetical protein